MSEEFHDNDRLQFVRLLAKIKVAGLGNETLQLLKKSMDLSTDEICEIMSRAEEEWSTIKAPTTPTKDEVPADILKVLEVDGGALDNVIHDEKSAEAAGINNDGYWSQLEYLRSNGWVWDMVRKALGLEGKEGS